MAGQAGVWMLLVLFQCFCTSTASTFPGFAFAGTPSCCPQSLGSSKGLVDGQIQIGSILFENRKIIFQKVGEDVQTVKKDIGTVMENQIATKGYIVGCQTGVLPNVNGIRKTLKDFLLNGTQFQETVAGLFGQVKKLEEKTQRRITEEEAVVKERVKKEHRWSRQALAQTLTSMQDALRDLKGVMKSVHGTVEALLRETKPGGNTVVNKPRRRNRQRKAPSFIVH